MNEKSANCKAGVLTSAILSTLVSSDNYCEDEDGLEDSTEEYFHQIPFSNFNSQDRICLTNVHNKLSTDATTIEIVTPIKKNNLNLKDASPRVDTPLTPTANLKMLLQAASPEIRNYERRKELFNTLAKQHTNQPSASSYQVAVNDQALDINSNKSKIDNKNYNPCSLQYLNRTIKQEQNEEMNENNKIEGPNVHIVGIQPKKANANSRKEKSLGLLCQRFLKLFPDYPKPHIPICLDKAARNLSVGRRRIYDIINVLESIKVVKRVAKSNYLWRGRIGLSNTISNIRKTAEESGLAEKLRMNFKLLSNYRSSIPLNEYSQSENNCERVGLLKRRDKSLGILSYQFVTLLVVQPEQEVSLDMAARVLITNGNPSDNKYKTKVRRLYDIANILTSLKLIGKVHYQGRRPTFSWIGNQVVNVPNTDLPTSAKLPTVVDCDQDKQGLDSLCEVAEIERRDLCLVTPSKNHLSATCATTKKCSSIAITPVKSNDKNCSLNSSFNSDEVFQKELESLRKRFPSPMSRLLSACNVEEALCQHNAKKQSDKNVKEEQNGSNNPKWKIADDSYSADKLSLSYLEQQQKHISKTVDNIFMNNNLGLEQSDESGIRKLYSNPIIEIKQPANRPLKTIVCNDGRVLVPVSNLQFMNSPGLSNTPMLLPVIKPKMKSALTNGKENIDLEEMMSSSIVINKGLTKKSGGVNKINVIKAVQCHVVPNANCGLGMGIKPLVSKTNVNIPDNKRNHFTISADGVSASQPKKFIKLDFNLKSFPRANSEPIIKTFKPILKNLANQQNLGKIQKISTSRNAGSVVTNLFTRLEKKTVSQDATGNFKGVTTPNYNSLKINGMRKAAVPLQSLLNLATNTNLLNGSSPSKIKRIKNPPRKLIMGDENCNVGVNGL